MTDARPGLLDLANEQLVFFDGATGTYLQTQGLTEDDFAGKDGCNEYLVVTRPDVVKGLHEAYFSVGSHIVETDSFGSTRIVLAEYDLAEMAYELNRRAAALAREVARDFSTPERPRYVAGSMGPTTKLPTLGHIGFDEMAAAYREQARGLIDGGADLLIVETCQDLLQIKAALYAIHEEFRRLGRKLPVAVSVTVEAVGTMLLGSELGAALCAVGALKPDIFGLNCATGPAEMKRHIQFLSQHSPFRIHAMPNAGLPENVGGRTVYPLTPEEFVHWQESFVREDGVRFVGGCCGTTREHIRRLVERLDGATPTKCAPQVEPSVSSLYFPASLVQEPPPFLIGERTNANGSKKFRELLLADDFEGMVALAKDQERGGAHALDVCAAYVGRDESRDMREILSRFVRQARLPLVVDSTQVEVTEAALKLAGGRCIVNSVNFEDGEAKARRIFGLARDFGAAVVGLTIDETGMARTAEHKLAVARRLVGMAVEEFGLSPSDVLIDALTFTVGSGDETLRDAAVQTLEAIRRLKAELPGALAVLGVSNISFGLKPRARHILNSVFLRLAIEAGLDAAIIDAAKILPLNRIAEAHLAAAKSLLLNVARPEAPDPLLAYIRLFEEDGGQEKAASDEPDASTLEERIQKKVVDGDQTDLEPLLSAALTQRDPLTVINSMLIPAMKVVGDLFGSGQMQLPFVLQSAEVMKRAVRFLEPFMDKQEGQSRGRLVLATVKGDVHDIGKNLVDILLSNNGYEIFNLGIKVPIEEMIRVWQEKKADAIGMSGLLVKSTVVMKENLEELRRRGLDPPVLLGGAALTRRYVEEDLRSVYGPKVAYGQDAFEGLSMMDRVMSGAAEAAAGSDDAQRPANIQDVLDNALDRAMTFIRPPDDLPPADPPAPPFFGTRIVELPLAEVLTYINETALFRGRWQYRRGKLTKEAFEALIEAKVRPAFEALKREAIETGLFAPRAVYGYFPCYAEGNDVVLFDSAGRAERARFRFPRMLKAPYHCVADYFRPKGEAPDVFGAMVVTIGEAASRRTAELFAQHQYLAYLHLHGLSVETAEAAAEYLHRKMRAELKIDEKEPILKEDVFQAKYRGARYSFGYPSCPRLDDQFPLFALLDAERIGVTLSENAQMSPEQSVSAFVVHHPAARYFNPAG
ncbi:MAG: methionine synthase [Myxococcales bacterium]|nr:MAG: methionine synthase [Myxococcales bacterium]